MQERDIRRDYHTFTKERVRRDMKRGGKGERRKKIEETRSLNQYWKRAQKGKKERG